MKKHFLYPLAVRRLMAGLASLLLLSGTACSTRCVLYGHVASRTNALTQADSTSVFFDRLGDLYPEAASGVAVDNERLRYHGSALQHYFQFLTAPDWQAAQQTQADALSSYYSVPLGPLLKQVAVRPAWLQLQDSLQTRFARRFARHLRASHTDALVVLVHGYNNKVGETKWYAALKRRLLADGYFRNRRVHFLHVYLDVR